MNKNLTWLKPSGEWGIEGVDLAALPPAAYGALAKLMRLEHPFRDPNPPLTLEELREMDGEPVWIQSVFGRIYALVEVSSGNVYFHTVNEKHRMNQWDFAAWEKAGAFVAYRRKPEEGTM